jgi:hypothetical protein
MKFCSLPLLFGLEIESISAPSCRGIETKFLLSIVEDIVLVMATILFIIDDKCCESNDH